MAVKRRKKNPKRVHCAKCHLPGHRASAHKRRKKNPFGALTGASAIYRLTSVGL